MSLTVGSQAPEFTLLDHRRQAVSLSGLRGSPVVLVLYPAAFTGVCTKEMCAFRDAIAAFNDLDAKVLGLSVDAPFSNAAFAAQNGIEYPLLSDYSRDVVRAYGVAHDDFAGMTGYTAAKRSVFVIDANGVIQYAWVAPNPGVEPDYAAVQAAVSALRG